MGTTTSKVQETVNVGSSSSSSNSIAQPSSDSNYDTFEIVLIVIVTYFVLETLKNVIRSYLKRYFKKQVKISTIRQEIAKSLESGTHN